MTETQAADLVARMSDRDARHLLQWALVACAEIVAEVDRDEDGEEWQPPAIWETGGVHLARTVLEAALDDDFSPGKDGRR